MTELRQAAMQALQYLESNADADSDWEIMIALRKALEQPEQEPVAWQWLMTAHFRKKLPKDAEKGAWNALYTTPPAAQRPWVGLTDEDMKDPKTHIFDFIYGARWAEAKLKERNNG